ncbi:MAG: extracellular solute-binding protein [Gammaproteobacteria bacterium]|nr:extracellular solute-binding protein [Gammaproteobacteria bacterium]
MGKTARRIGTGLAACSLGVSSLAIAVTPGAASARTLPRYTITIQLPGNTGTLNSPQNRVLKALTLRYERMHPNITVDWQPAPGTIPQVNAQLVARASAHAATDVVLQWTGDFSELPQGILQNLKPYLLRKSPYAKGYKTWLATWKSSTLPYMEAPNGNIDILLGSTVTTEILYNKADFAKAGIKSVPTTYAEWLADMAKLKKAGITPFMFGTGGGCDPGWYETRFQSALLHSQIAKFNVNHQHNLTGLDVAVGIQRGIISMKNPAYAEGWKLLGQLRPYMAPGQSSYDACSAPTQSGPPLSELQPFVQNKFAMAWMGSWDIPDLNQLGFRGKFGFFPFPTITKATTPYSVNLNVTGTVGGPNGSGNWGVTSQAADASMTPAKTGWVINFLQWLYAPQNEASWIADSSNNAYIPVIKGTKMPPGSVPGLSSLLPKKFPPPSVGGITGGTLTAQAQNEGLRLVQAYVGGSMTYSAFAQQWQTLLNQAAQQWAQANKVNLSKY